MSYAGKWAQMNFATIFSASLLRIAREADVGEFFGQELNRTTYNLARMNMILHDVYFSKFDIKQEDTLTHLQHLDEGFDVVVANPPFSARWKGKDNPLNETDDRFSQYGALAPTTKADFAFVQYMLYQFNPNLQKRLATTDVRVT